MYWTMSSASVMPKNSSEFLMEESAGSGVTVFCALLVMLFAVTSAVEVSCWPSKAAAVSGSALVGWQPSCGALLTCCRSCTLRVENQLASNAAGTSGLVHF